MTQPSNIGAVDANSLASTKSFFNNTSLPPISVSQNVDDAIIAYFQQIAENKDAARAMASAVILTSVSQGIDPMETLQQFMKMNRDQLSSYVTMFLNLNRVGTSYLGINNSPTVSKYVARTILP
jgi:hypothetical protein